MMLFRLMYIHTALGELEVDSVCPNVALTAQCLAEMQDDDHILQALDAALRLKGLPICCAITGERKRQQSSAQCKPGTPQHLSRWPAAILEC